jgi:hypothetical protein
VVVPRTRFAPVKTTSDLFVLRSDVFSITPAATVEAVVPSVRVAALLLIWDQQPVGLQLHRPSGCYNRPL